jgi:hypothetical protein
MAEKPKKEERDRRLKRIDVTMKRKPVQAGCAD